MSKKNIAKLRAEIDAVDSQLIEFISRRARLAEEVAKVKSALSAEDTEFYRPEREAQIFKKVIEQNKGPLSKEEITRLFREIMSACLALEQTLKIAYLGPEGTFTQTAALKHFGHSVKMFSLDSIEQVFRKVETGTLNFGVIPIENSIEGVVNYTLDMLNNSNLKICGEVEMPIHHNLMGKDRTYNNITKVYSHQQSLAQCRVWLDTYLSNVERVAVASNAEAARIVKNKAGFAAIASETASEIYNLNILASNIEDQFDNTTRFLVIGKNSCPPSGTDKTSLLFSMPNKPGALHRMLRCFADNKVSMTRIESRPSRLEMWDYIFFVDIEGHAEEVSVKKSLTELKNHATMLRLLGSYPKAIL